MSTKPQATQWDEWLAGVSAYPLFMMNGWLHMGSAFEHHIALGIHERIAYNPATFPVAKALVQNAQEVFEMADPNPLSFLDEGPAKAPDPTDEAPEASVPLSAATTLGQEITGGSKPYFVVALGPTKAMAYALEGPTLSIRVEWPDHADITPGKSNYKALGFKVADSDTERYASIHLDVGKLPAGYVVARKCIGAFLFALGEWDEVAWSEPPYVHATGGVV